MTVIDTVPAQIETDEPPRFGIDLDNAYKVLILAFMRRHLEEIRAEREQELHRAEA